MVRSRSNRSSFGVAVALAVLFAGSGACGITVRGDALEAAPPGSPPENAENAENEEQIVTTCAPTETRCGEACVSLASSADHCGGCGKACAQGMVCEDSRCVPFCEPGSERCGDACVDPKVDAQNCGGCGVVCGAKLVCSAGECVVDCAAGLTRCPGQNNADVCVDTTMDPKHCGTCGKACAAGEICRDAACTRLCAAVAEVGDVFGPDMVGCRGRVRYSARASLCPEGTHVCSAAEWVQRRQGRKPTYNYWTNDKLDYWGSSWNCSAVRSGVSCGDNPMRVCAARFDPLQNECNWVECGLGSSNNEWFGGCVGNRYAGALCCR